MVVLANRKISKFSHFKSKFHKISQRCNGQIKTFSRSFLHLLLIGILPACNLKEDRGTFYMLDVLASSGASNATAESTSFSLSGSATGLSGTVVLSLNSSETISVQSDGTFVFTTRFNKDGNYSVSIQSKPSNQDCNLANATGVFTSENVTNLTLTCSTNPDKRIFLTASTFSGDLQGAEANGILGADAKCEADGNKPSTGTYKAFLVNGANRRACNSADCVNGGADENRDWVLKKDTRYIRASDSAEIFTTNSSKIFIFGTATNSFTTATLTAWTGIATTLNWVNSTYDCGNWLDNSTSVKGAIGTSTNTDYTLIRDPTTIFCDQNNHLICVEQ